MIPFDSAQWIVLSITGVLASISAAALVRQWLTRLRREHRLREKSLAQSVLQLRELFEEAPVAYHEIDQDGIIRRVNRAECRLLGYQPSALVGKPVWEFVEPAQRESARKAVLRKLADKEPLAVLEEEIVRCDGTLHPRRIRDSSRNPHRVA